VQYIYTDGTLGLTDEAISTSNLEQREKEKERDKGREKWKNKEKGKKEVVSINSPFSVLSRRMRYGSNSSRSQNDRSFKLISNRSIGLLSNRSGSGLSHSSTGILSHRSTGMDCDELISSEQDAVEDATRCLYQ
jgi:hypothetical protein